VSDRTAAEGRACGGCTGCCRIPPIREMDKPANVPCIHCGVGVGCRIYAERPPVCQKFMCNWLTQIDVGDHWYPPVSNIVLAEDRASATLIAHVDSAFPDAWRQAPYYDELHQWAANPTPTRQRVCVKLGEELIAIFPVGEKSLGPMRSNQVVLIHKIGTMFWTAYDAELVNETDPRAAGAIGRKR
jgi:hypothetical protein